MTNNVKITITEAVKEILQTIPYLDEFFREGCVNNSALAEKIHKEVEQRVGKKHVNKEAIIMSVIRYGQHLESENLSKITLKAIAGSTLTLRTDMVYCTIPKTITNLKMLENIYNKIEWSKGETFFIVQGIGEISVVLDKERFPLLEKEINKQEISFQFPNTAIVIVHSPPEATAPGFIHFITRDIAKAGISVELLTMTHDSIFLVDEKNATKLVEIIKKTIDNARAISSSTKNI